MIQASDLVERAKSFANADSAIVGYRINTCYLKGFWGQRLTKAEYDRILKMYPKNSTYGNVKYIGTEVFPFDCVCFIKALLAGASVNKRLTYTEMAANPLGDCPNSDPVHNTGFLEQLYDCVDSTKAPAGYGLATSGHAALSLGNGMWIDANFGSGQNGVAIHNTGIGAFTKAGKLPGVDYEALEPKVGDTIPMVITSIENGIAYGQIRISEGIQVGSKVTIKPGAKAGGTNKQYRGKPIKPEYANGKYVDTVTKLETHYGVEEALLKGIFSWVATSSLTLV